MSARYGEKPETHLFTAEKLVQILNKGSQHHELGKACVTEVYIATYCRSGNFRIAFFRLRNVRAFNFRRLSNWRKTFNGENFPIYGS